MHAVARREAQAIVFPLSVVLVLLVAGLEFVRRRVGLAYLVLWVAIAVATAVFRRPGGWRRRSASSPDSGAGASWPGASAPAG